MRGIRMCFGPELSGLLGVTVAVAAAHAVKRGRPWRGVFYGMLASVEFVELAQYIVFARGGGQCAESVASMWVMVVLISTQPLLFLAIGEEEQRGREGWWFRHPRLRASAWALYAFHAVVAAPMLLAGAGRCTWWFCDEFTGTSLGWGRHIAWHLAASELTHVWMILYVCSLAVLAATGARRTALTFAGTLAVTHLAFGAHTGPAVWCALAGSSGLLEFLEWCAAGVRKAPRVTRPREPTGQGLSTG